MKKTALAMFALILAIPALADLIYDPILGTIRQSDVTAVESSTNTYTAPQTYNAGITVNTGDVIVVDGSIGFGTNSPQARLHINGSTIIDTNLTVGGVLTANTFGTTSATLGDGTDNTVGYIKAKSSGYPKLAFQQGSSDVFQIQAHDATKAGYFSLVNGFSRFYFHRYPVGIGTNSVAYPLHVNGDICSESNVIAVSGSFKGPTTIPWDGSATIIATNNLNYSYVSLAPNTSQSVTLTQVYGLSSCGTGVWQVLQGLCSTNWSTNGTYTASITGDVSSCSITWTNTNRLFLRLLGDSCDGYPTNAIHMTVSGQKAVILQ